jgi:hypothetical protein
MSMRFASVALAAALAVGLSGKAWAEEDRCPETPAQQWMAIDKVVEKAESLGYAVSQAKRSKGCWEVEGYDRNGAEIEIRFNPATGDVVKPRGWRAPAGG